MATPRSDVDVSTNYRFESSALARQYYDTMLGPVTYHVTIAQQPKRSRTAGVGAAPNRRPIGPAPTPVLKILNSNGQDCTYPYLFTKVVFAQVSLLHAETREPVPMIQARGTYLNPLYGNMISCCQYISRPLPGDPTRQEEVGAFPFGDLSVRREGLYVLAFYIWEVADGEGLLRGIAHSNTFRVYPAKDFPGMVESTPFTDILRQHGIRVRFSKNQHVNRTREYHQAHTNGSGNDEENRAARPLEMVEDHQVEYYSRDSSPASEYGEEAMDDVMTTVPPGGVLPIPMHTSAVMNYNEHDDRFAYASQQQSSQSYNNFNQFPPMQQSQYQMAEQLPSISRMPLSYGHHVQHQFTQWDPVQESQAVSRPERRNGMEFRDFTFFPPPDNQSNYQGYNQGGDRRN